MPRGHARFIADIRRFFLQAHSLAALLARTGIR